MDDIGNRLRQERERLKLNRSQLAKLAGITGGSQTNYESGVRSPDATYLAAIAAIGVDVSYLLTGKPLLTKPLSEDEDELLACYRQLDIRGKVNALGMISSLKNTTDKVKENLKTSGITVHGSVGDVSQIKGNVKIGNITKTTRIGGDTKKKPHKS